MLCNSKHNMLGLHVLSPSKNVYTVAVNMIQNRTSDSASEDDDKHWCSEGALSPAKNGAMAQCSFATPVFV